ncbi:amino acid adenylation domain-containing protein [Micromonospora echinofusca]|uniref:Amino acid adenylation domain-containing protein n=1 Tax=Micromonospora echinofusca TaxID=47858 RepID=A0ABS3VJD4_MICEH|nr:amino acid adenylation domain-containing protein [Micromonospora echinofusca]MBO4204635.1 amino acid adenylation domain-containing protein [Micromonospora echinofusca]
MLTFVHEAVEEAARRYPTTVAVAAGTGPPVTYRELLRAVHALAGTLRDRVNPGGRVAVVSRKAPETVVAMLATLHAGMSYVPVDPAAPRQRRDFILDQAACELMLADPADAAADRVDLPVLDPAVDPRSGAGTGAGAGVPARLCPDDEAYVLYTSGSTGDPKGVVITHRNAAAFVRWARRALPLAVGDQVAVHAPLHFDLPVYDLYVGLAGGATLHLVPERTALFPQALQRFLTGRRISHLYAVPSALTALLNRSGLRRDGLPALRRLLYAGEEFRPHALAALMAAVPQATVENLYGPIETNVVTRWRVTGPPDDRVPLGRPVDGVTLALLADDGTASEHAPGEGEIVVAGDCVTPGYLGRPDLTARSKVELCTESGTRRFYRTGDHARRDDDGVLHLLGRRDGLVKTRGYRVELGEIEARIGGHPAVAEVAVVAEPDPELTHRLSALVVPADDRAPDAELVAELLRHCRERLPGYMVPGAVRVVSALPRTSTGKIARARLADLLAVPGAQS